MIWFLAGVFLQTCHMTIGVTTKIIRKRKCFTNPTQVLLRTCNSDISFKTWRGRALEYLRRVTLAAQMCFLLTKATTGHLVLDLTKNSNKKHGKQGLMYHKYLHKTVKIPRTLA